MNSNLNRALSAAILVLGGVAPALAQYDDPGHCIDPNSTASPYSNDYNMYYLQTQLFGAGIGVAGTIAYQATLCEGTSPIRGRIGFTVGPQGSIQDNILFASSPGSVASEGDDHLRLTQGFGAGQEFPIPGVSFAGPYFAPSSGGLSYARVQVRTQGTTPTTTSYLYGSVGFSLAFIGRSGRYMYTEGPVNGTNVNVRCIIDVLGDAARVNWRLTNTSTNPLGLGLWFGQRVALIGEDGLIRGVPFATAEGPFQTEYITIPGRKPLTVHERFNTTGLSPSGQAGGATIGIPPYVNFSGGQKSAFGLQVVNSPTALSGVDANSTNDQTPVDEFVIGESSALTDGHYNTADPAFNDFIFNAVGNGNADAAPLGTIPSYIQKWEPSTVVPAGGSRDITAYYRPTNFDSSYSAAFQGYTAVVDTPKAISTNSSDPTVFSQNPITIRVNVDNTGGFSITDTTVRMQSVQVTLNLPAGMHAVNSTSRTMIKNISSIDPASMGSVDFQVAIDANTVGSLPYSVTIVPQPGFATKTLTGQINVAATPRLLVRNGANLVSPPWEFADNSWEGILGLDLDADFQSYTWDAQLQQYVTQTAAERGRGSWIVSKSDLGTRVLAGSPQQPADEFPDPTNFDVGGAPIVRLQPGWNLLGNPYNYAFPLGQITGIPVGQNNLALTYSDLVRLGYTDGSFSSYDQDLHGYGSPTQGIDARLQPNRGYWVYAAVAFDIQFPPLYDLFIRSAVAEPTFAQRFNNWKLQLSAATSNATDLVNVGIVRNPSDATALSYRKAPIAPTTDAVRSFVTNGSLQMGSSLRYARGKQTFTYNVNNKAAGPVTVSWPNLKQIPSNLAVSIVDNVTKKKINARSSAGYTYTAPQASVRSFTVTVTPQGTVSQRIGSVGTQIVQAGSIKLMNISFVTSGRGAATLQVLKNGVAVGTVASDIDIVAGTNKVTWPMIGSNGLPLPNGTYVLAVAATGEAGVTSVKQVSITVRR